ncbi:MAG: carbamoyl phosphate synthase large subunit [Caldiserica bacterium]|nr:MAG: carbamoyl phosphate synthase large subunit [Caldisericota bacterium]
MPKRTDLEKILVIGSGPIIIGQACEFDYSGSQALKALKEEGYKTILVNSNPATIMTDPEMATKVYIEPLTVEYLEKIIKKERPDAILPTLGGQTALNLAVELHEKGILEKYNVELIGANVESIKKAESREMFKKLMKEIGIETPKSGIARNLEEARKIAKRIGLPLIIRPAFTLGGTGGAVVEKEDEFSYFAKKALEASPVSEILIEESVVGWKEFELEVMRDKKDNCVVICSIENLDPMGVHTGDSITVAPAQTLTDKEYQELRNLSFKIIRAVGVDTGGSNIQFAVNPENGKIYAIEMNPRVSRSSALASKATGFPIAKIAAKLAVGYTLDEIPNDITKKTPASFEPVIDYVVVKIPRFNFEKFLEADQRLNSSMKSVGEVLSFGRTFKEALQKAIRSLEIGRFGLGGDGMGQTKRVEKLRMANRKSRMVRDFLKEIKEKLKLPNCDRIFNIKYGLQMGLTVEEISKISKIDKWFINQIKEIVEMEERIKKCKVQSVKCKEILKEAKQYGFSDYQIGYLTKRSEKEIRNLRKKLKILPTYKSVDTCSAEFESYTPYFYSTYEEENEISNHSVTQSLSRSVLIIGGGPNRIGQGIEFDYCICHASFALREEGFFSIIVNSNPETVSTDYDTSDRLYFEPLTPEDVLNIIETEKPYGVIVQLGGQTPLNLTKHIKKKARILGTQPEAIDLAEDRIKFSKFLKKINVKNPEWGKARSIEEALRVCKKIGYPVILRPSYVLGGRAMEIAYEDEDVERYLERATEVNPEHPVLIDKFLENAIEVDVDAVCDGESVFIAPLMEHIEEAGIHSGDSACVTPPVSLLEKTIEDIKKITEKIALNLGVIGLINLQFAVKNGKIYVLEVNPRASRTVPFISKAIGVPLAKIATKIMIGKKLKDFNLKYNLKDYCVKEVVLPFIRFSGVDPVLGPEMKSTGEVMGRAKSFHKAYLKAQIAAGNRIPEKGNILISLSDRTKNEAVPIIKLYSKKYKIFATPGTAKFLKRFGIKVRSVEKIGKGDFDVEHVIKNKIVSLIINTPSGKKSYSDGYWIRRWAYENQIPLITTLSACKALIK